MRRWSSAMASTVRMGAYVVGEDGVLERYSVAPEEELRPLSASPAVP